MLHRSKTIMNLDDSQKATVRTWIEAGAQPAEIQKRIGEEFGVSLTYMEVRFLLADLDLKPKDQDVPPDPAVAALQKKEAEQTAAAPGGMDDQGPGPEGSSTGGVSLSVDRVTRAGSVVSGQVTFSDGKRAEWYLDQMGRLGLAPAEKGYKPSQADVMDFQTALQNELAKQGF